MKFAVMQPYLFPYLGYYQLVKSVDKFILYDDVTFIKGGFINRNNILSNNKILRFTIPVPGGSSNKLINELKFDVNVKKILKTIEQSYRKAPFFKDVYPIIESVINDGDRRLEFLCKKSITSVFDYLGLKYEVIFSSDLEYDRSKLAADKLIEMSKVLGIRNYINSPGGIDLYDKEYFDEHNVTLKFIQTNEYNYQQKTDDFIPNLSMIDVLMWNKKEDVKELLNQYRLI